MDFGWLVRRSASRVTNWEKAAIAGALIDLAISIAVEIDLTRRHAAASTPPSNLLFSLVYFSRSCPIPASLV